MTAIAKRRMPEWTRARTALPGMLAIALLAPASAAADDIPPPMMNLGEALQHALVHSGVIEAARHGTDALEAKVQQADAYAWPHGELTSFFAPIPAQEGPVGGGYADLTKWGVVTQTQITAWVPIYTFNKISNLREAMQLGADVGRAQEAIAAAEVRFQVLRGFFALSMVRELVSVIKEGREYLDKARKHVDELAKSDDASFDPVDRMKVRVYDSQVKAKELEARRSLALAEGALRYAIGLSPGAPVGFLVGPPTPIQPTEAAALDDLITRALDGRSEMVALRTGVSARTAAVAARRSAFYPDLVAVGMFKYGYTNVFNRGNVVDDPYNTLTGGGGIALKWDFEIARKLGELHEAEAELGKLESQMHEAERGVRLEVEKTYREMVDSREMVDAQKDAMQAARGWVIAKQDLYENGMAEINDVLTGLVAFFQARLDHVKAIYDYNVSVAALERATGATLVPVPGAE